MDNDVIGFKLADGSFYPVFQEGTAVEKQLELTTVRDDQTTIQLHLYKSPSGTMEGATYVETLVLENLMPHPKEEPSLSLKLALDDEGNLSAEIVDPETGLSSSTNVSLVTLDEATLHGLTDDFTLDGIDMPTMSEFSVDDMFGESEEPAPEDSAVPEETTESPADDFDFSMPEETTDVPAEEPEAPKFSLPVDDFPSGEFKVPDDFPLPEESVQEASFDIDFSDDTFDTSDIDSGDQFKYEDIPDFGDIPEATGEADAAPELDLGPVMASSFADEEFYEESLAEERRSQRKFRVPVIICIVCAIISVIVLAIILWLAPSRIKKQNDAELCLEETVIETPAAPVEDLTKARENEVVVSPVPVVPEPPKKTEPDPTPAPVEPVATAPVAESPAPATTPVAETPAPAKKEPKSVRYKLKWGDTLWDLADAYYRNPWQYKKIARWNGIKNPDYIIAGTYIYIPE